MTDLRPTLTTDINEFIRRLRDADILLFNTLHHISNVIKLADNSPVNHCALFQEYGETILHASIPKDGGPAVRAECLRCRLALGKDRTVTALRLPNNRIRKQVLAQANYWAELTPNYAFKALPSLAAQCINRSYRLDSGKIKRALMSQASRAMTSLPRMDRKRISVTCSEFVYTCYIASDCGSIEIRDPLSVWEDDEEVTDVYYIEWLTPGGVMRKLYKLFDPEAPDPEPGIAPPDPGEAAAPEPRPSEDDPVCDAMLAKEWFRMQEDGTRNAKLGKKIPRSCEKRPPYAPSVTPFDLWQSKSLTAVHVLHLPPIPGDRMWERTGGL
jgi:hypothetical protein